MRVRFENLHCTLKKVGIVLRVLMRVLRQNLRVEIKNETRVFLESLNFEIEMRVSQKSEMQGFVQIKLKFN